MSRTINHINEGCFEVDSAHRCINHFDECYCEVDSTSTAVGTSITLMRAVSKLIWRVGA